MSPETDNVHPTYRGGEGDTARRLAAFAAVAALAGFVALFLTEASAQTIDITSTIRSTAEFARRDIEPAQHGAGGRSLSGESTITGPVTLEIEFSSSVTTPTLSMFSVTNATLSDLQNTSTYRNWTFLLTPTADGPARSVQLAPGGFNRWNTASTYSATADLGAPTIVWWGFSSANTRNNNVDPDSDDWQWTPSTSTAPRSLCATTTRKSPRSRPSTAPSSRAPPPSSASASPNPRSKPTAPFASPSTSAETCSLQGWSTPILRRKASNSICRSPTP